MRNYANPIEESQTKLADRVQNEVRFHQRFKVVFVVDYPHDKVTEAELTIKKYCNEVGITFLTRYYNQYEYKDDCNHIARLPACHMYLKTDNEYLQTFYPDENPIQTIKKEVTAVREKAIRKEESKKMWKKRLLHLSPFSWGKKRVSAKM